MKLRTVLVLIALVAVACTQEPASLENDEVAHVMDPEGRCANEGVAFDHATPDEAEMKGDLDGDGEDDVTYIAHDGQGDIGCRSFLVVDAAGIAYSAPVDPSGDQRALEIPSLNSLVQLDEEPGAEIVVNIETGASTQFVGVFTLTDEGLERVTIEGRGPGPFAGELGDQDLFAFGGSVGHLEAVDCLGRGAVVMSAAVPKGDSADEYEVERRFFLMEGTELILDPDATERHTIEGLNVDRFPEYRSSPFGGCR